MKNNNILPRIVDIYHDVILADDHSLLVNEYNCPNKVYIKLLKEYYVYLNSKMKLTKDYVKLCCHGMDFFLSKGLQIHFVFENYDKKINYITRQESIYAVEHDLPIKFYKIHNDRIVELHDITTFIY